jgi:hypothetical protein
MFTCYLQHYTVNLQVDEGEYGDVASAIQAHDEGRLKLLIRSTVSNYEGQHSLFRGERGIG